MISVIVPVYNVSRYIEKCVESILQQTWRDFELIMVNDGSTDDSGQIIDRYALEDSRIRVSHKENGGVSSARNCGLSMVRGEYVTFIDADDWVAPEHLQNFMSKAADYDWVMQGMVGLDKQGKTVNTWKVPHQLQSQDSEEVDRMLPRLPAFGWITNKLFNMSIIKRAGLQFLTTLPVQSDRIFNIEYSRHVRSFVMLPTVTYHYAHNPNSLVHSFVHPRAIVTLCKECERMLRAGNTGSHMSAYIGAFCMRFYVRAMSLCVTSPMEKLPLLPRLGLLLRILYDMLSSYTLRKYKLRAVSWAWKSFLYYVKKVFDKNAQWEM